MAALPPGYAYPRHPRSPTNEYTPSRHDVPSSRGRIAQHEFDVVLECILEDEDAVRGRASAECRPLTADECADIEFGDEMVIAHVMSYDKMLR